MAVRFADLTFDGEAREVLRADARVHLEPKAFELLALLVARRPSALSKEEIRGAIWPDTVVSESSLPGLVADLRKALGDDPAEPRLIRTVRGYGYAFCGQALGETDRPEAPFRWVALCDNREIPLPEGVHVIGRDRDCQVRSDSVRVSRRHARIRIVGEQAFLEDLGSRNGTRLNGERIEGRQALGTGDSIQVGSAVIRVVDSGPDASTVPD